MKARASTFAAALVLGGALAGCNLIVGSDDYVVGDGGSGAIVPGDETPVTALPDSSMTGDDATTVTPMEAGTTADASEADGGNDATSPDAAFVFEGGVPLEAGTVVSCGSGGALVLGSQSDSADFQKLVDTCVHAVSCDRGQFPATMSRCISENYLQAIGSVACLSTISDCNGYYGCQGDRVATTAECKGKGVTGFCTGNVATTCDGSDYTGSVQDCDKLGGTCKVHVDASGDTVADCAVVPSCTDQDTDEHCSGNKLYECVDGVGYGENCGAINATCSGDGSFDGASCFFNAPACSGAGSRCTGDVLTSCSDDSTQQFDYQCSRAGLSCIDTVNDIACVAPGCDPPSTTSCTEQCGADGITADVCVGGALFPIDCSKHGFNRCVDDGSGDAYCVY